MCYCSQKCADDKLHKEGCSHVTFIGQDFSLFFFYNCHILKLLSQFEPTDTITIHAIGSNPTFDPDIWERHFIHNYSKLRNLELFLLTQGDNSVIPPII